MKNRRLWTLYTLFLTYLPTLAWADGAGHGPGVGEGYGWGGHMWGGGMIFGPLLMIGFFVLAVYLAFLLVRWIGGLGSAPGNPAAKSALEILNERLARGEIEKDDYEERKQILSS